MSERVTLVLGATEKTDRYANIAIRRLLDAGEKVIAVGNKTGEVRGVEISTSFPEEKNIHTITLYLSAKNQATYYDAILSVKPKRVIFNPGTHNDELEKLLNANNIAYESACTLVMLSANTY
jgi:predicted CoA-binding protein